MGIFNFLRSELIDIIEWVEESNDVLMWKFPDQDREIKYGAQLTVRESQMAIFVNEGQIADVFGPGRHELATRNMPLLTTLKSWKYGFESPFKVDIYFFSTRQFLNLKWGTPNPIMMRDPEFKQVRVQAFGTYAIRIKDGAGFFREFAGTASILRFAEVEERLRSLVVPKFTEALAEAQVSVLDMAAHYSEIGDKLRPILQTDLDPFGLELMSFQVASTSLPPEVAEFYDKMTSMNMVTDMTKFQQFTTATAVEEAAKRGGGGGGMEIGAGFVIANQLLNNQGPPASPPPVPPLPSTPEAPAADREAILATLKQLGDLKAAGILTEEEFAQKKKELLDRL
jgi:membrane protease subunit (stomatin/prohibitin family)